MRYKNARLVDPDGIRNGGFEIKDGVIKSVGKREDGTDLGNKMVVPMLLDMNVSLYEERLSSQNLKRLSQNAVKGGVGGVSITPTLAEELNDEIHLEFLKSQCLDIDIYPSILATKGEGLSEIATLSKKYGRLLYVDSDTNPYLLARIFEYAKMLKIPLKIDIQNRILKPLGVMNEGEVSFKLGLGGRSKLEEYMEVAKIIEFSEFYGVGVIFGGISTARSIELIATSSYGYSEVSVHHLLKTEAACEGYNTYAKLNPPLRDEDERQKLLELLQNGFIDFLTSLHTPKPYTQKDISFDEAAYGIESIHFYLPLLYTKFVKEGIISFEKVIELACANPAAKLGVKRGFVKCGYEAKLALFDEDYEFEGEGLYKGERFFGRIELLKERNG